MSCGSDRFIELRNGPVVPVEPLLLVLDLEARGFALTSADDQIIVSPGSQLTADDCRQLKRWKSHVLALLAYTAPTLG
jgi:hypothetical protein